MKITYLSSKSRIVHGKYNCLQMLKYDLAQGKQVWRTVQASLPPRTLPKGVVIVGGAS